MSSRMARTLLKLYPRRIRDRYGEELLDLEDELRARGEVTGPRLIRDMLTGALVIRHSRARARSLAAAVLVATGLVVAGAVSGGGDTGAPARQSHHRAQLIAQAVPAQPYGACPVAAGASCSLDYCTEFISEGSGDGAIIPDGPPATQRARRARTTGCPAQSPSGPPRAVPIALPGSSTRHPLGLRRSY